MQYHPETIPILEAMQRHAECSLCALERAVEIEAVERTLGESLMEPEERVRVNRLGFCRDHQRMLYAQQNRLGHALLTDSILLERLSALQTIQNDLQNAGASLRPPRLGADPLRKASAALRGMQHHCAVCDTVASHMKRYRRVFLRLWKYDASFRAMWDASHGVCLPHAEALMESASGILNRRERLAFAGEALARLTEQLTKDEQDVDQFTRKFDYRNQAEPWGDSKTGVERAVNRLRGWCLGPEPTTRDR